MSDPALTDTQRLTVYALRSEGAVARLAGASAVRGFYRPDSSGSSAFVPRSAGSKGVDWDLDTDEIFFHEYAHHRWFAKANRLDTENAEPLRRFYQTYAYAGVEPTRNSVEGLLYAVALVPQDDGLRVSAVRELLVEGRLADARAMFAPMAFQPHAPKKYRESNAQVMSAIDAADGKRALAVLEGAMQAPDDEDGKR